MWRALWTWKGALVAAAAIVGGGVGYAIAANEVASALTLLGAVVVAGTAAWAADRRLDRQLVAAAERHERELEHDRRERAADRAHDRNLKRLGELQRVLDEAAVGVQRVREAADPVAAAHAAPVSHVLDDDAADTRIELHAAATALETLAVRVELRLTDRGPAGTLRRLRKCAVTLLDAAEQVLDRPVGSYPHDVTEAVARASNELHAVAVTFRRDAVAVIGSQAQRLGVEVGADVSDAMDEWSEERAEGDHGDAR